MPRFFVGAISGTSVDGLDLAVISSPDDVDQPLRINASLSVELPPHLRGELTALAQPGADEVRRAGLASAQLGDFIGTAIVDFLRDCALTPADIEGIGSHGQTIRHHPEASPAFSVQIGDGSRIAETTGIDTITDFRARDIAAGGEGAPLVPRFHEEMFRSTQTDRVLLNLGGIANISVLARDRPSVFGFDTGPANALMDCWIDLQRGQAYDDDGAWAASGTCNSALLEALMNDSYLDRPPPKSTGKERYNLAFIETALARVVDAIAEQDVQATLCEFTAASVANAITQWATQAGEVVVCGGGRRNGHLMSCLRALLPAHGVVIAEDIGVDGDGLEAAAFAWLAKCFIDRIPGNAPDATGARGPRILGCLYPAR